MTRVLVTGATGFVGSRLSPSLIGAGHAVVAAVRRADHPRLAAGAEPAEIADIGPDTDWTPALKGIDAVVHLAARVHVTKEDAADPGPAYRRVNANGTAALAGAAAAAGVRRFVYVSTSKVMGEASGAKPFVETDPRAPADAYGMSKAAGEEALLDAARGTPLETVIVRPPLVYGPGVGANFLTLLKVCRRAPPLPFAAVDNRRSIIYLDNLVSALIRCLERPEAAGETYFVRDGEDVSTPGLIRMIADAMGRPVRLFPCPAGLLRLAGWMTGNAGAIERALGTLQVDDAKIRRHLDWTPPVDMVQGLQETAAWFASRAGRRDDADNAR